MLKLAGVCCPVTYAIVLHGTAGLLRIELGQLRVAELPRECFN